MTAAGTVNAYFAPQKVGSIVIDPEAGSDDVKLEFSGESTNNVDDLRSLLVPSLTRGAVLLSSVADVKEVQEPETINRLEAACL